MLGLILYRLIVLIANVMFSLVQTIAYIILPTTEAYGTFLKVFHLFMVVWISDEVYCALGVAIDGRCWMVESSFHREVSC